MKAYGRAFAGLLLLGSVARGAESGTQEPLSDPVRARKEARFFEDEVRPLLARRCYRCHGPSKQESGLRLDVRESFLRGGESGAVVAPGEPDASLLIRAVRRLGPEMPPDRTLSEREVEVLTRWVRIGAPWPEGAPRDGAGGFRITPEDRSYWAFRPLERPAVPAVRDEAWVTNPIDAFILRRLEAEGLRPNPPASRRKLARRLSYDLTGLPPDPGDLADYLADDAPDAYERFVDRLLASPDTLCPK